MQASGKRGKALSRIVAAEGEDTRCTWARQPPKFGWCSRPLPLSTVSDAVGMAEPEKTIHSNSVVLLISWQDFALIRRRCLR